ncbi:MAG: hypothetical protein EI684_15910 [Candidatus Viridilinea halotolerans]|uniref:Uncharacterized protein n=1 Tax=Candidatus Viridilinea halotolerans TaxID=2491704 RepID=A0A426TVA6_9CHLR|nr:MAG: hypothetical protein EI684_15910 [Candidatus Viridilinea halotolerans]
MINQDDFTNEEWHTILQAPAFTMLYVIQASNCGPIAAYQKMLVGMRILTQPLAGEQDSDLVYAVRSAICAGQAPNQPDALPKDLAEAHQMTLERCQAVVDLLGQRVPDHEATVYLNWLLALGRAVAATEPPHVENDSLGFLATALAL